MIRCEQNAPMEFQVESSSSDTTYRVRAFLPDSEPPTCFCTSYAIKRNRAGGLDAVRELHVKGKTVTCKHVDQVLRETCPWTEENKVKQTIPGVCPLCGDSTTDDSNTTVLPENINKAANAAMESLLAMANDLGSRVDEDEDEDEVPSRPVPNDKWGKDDLEDLLAHLKR